MTHPHALFPILKSLIRAFIIKSCRNLVFLYSLCPILEVSTSYTSFFFVATKLIDDGESYNTLL